MKHATRFLALLLTAVALFLFVSCSSSKDGVSVPNGMKNIVSEANDYNLIVPNSWLEDTTVGLTCAYAQDDARSSVSVCANELTKDINTIEAYWDSFQTEFTASFSDFTLLDTAPTDETIGGMEGKKYRYTATVGGTTYQWMQILFIRNATIYVFTYTSTQDGYEGNLEDVGKIISNFSFR